MTPSKPVLFTIHGIYTDGPWQSGAASVLEPFYQHFPLKYDEYRRWAIFRLAADLVFALLFTVLGLSLSHFGLLSRWRLAVYLAITVFTVVMAHLYARRFRLDVMTKVYEEMTKIVASGPRPFVIAHSLGTYLLGKTLRQFQDWRCHTIILTGCVLTRRFPWSTMLLQFHYVWNEVSRRDFVPLAATLLSATVRDMGCAGTFGFKSTLEVVHNISPSTPNPNCWTRPCECTSHK
jgi:pimeloyl-ACP methyl ester carboxylesterase